MAEAQGGLFTLDQARACGLAPATVDRRCRRGWLRRVRRGVFSFAGGARSHWDAVVAAVLAAGPAAAVSHRSAARVHGFPGILQGRFPEVTVPADVRVRLGGVRLHALGPVPPADLVERRGVLVTSPARTVVDLAGGFGDPLLGAVVDEGLVRRWWSVVDIESCLVRKGSSTHGASQVRRLLAVRRDLPGPDSHLERRVLAYLGPLQPFEVHYSLDLGGIVVCLDAAWPWWKVAAEIDGRSYRERSRTAHDRESRKLNALTVNHWSVGHLTATMAADECLDAMLALMPAQAFPDLRARRRSS